MNRALACAFPGQGVQRLGMARYLQNTNSWRLFEEANDLLGYDLGKLTVEGPVEQLNDTAKAQPAIFVTCYALWDLYRDYYAPQIVLGHSLGELTALAVAGAFSFADGVRLVARRGQCMDNNGEPGGMVAVLGLELSAVQELCAEISSNSYVQVANENSPQQIVVSGLDDGLELLSTQALARGAKRVVRLKVSGPFHSSLMEPAASKFADVVQDVPISACKIPVLSNDGYTLLQEPDQIRSNLVEQMVNPVRFVASIHKLVELGVTDFVEVSSDPLLIPLARRIAPNLQFSLVSEGGM